jgi:hypothetical protein
MGEESVGMCSIFVYAVVACMWSLLANRHKPAGRVGGEVVGCGMGRRRCAVLQERHHNIEDPGARERGPRHGLRKHTR